MPPRPLPATNLAACILPLLPRGRHASRQSFSNFLFRTLPYITLHQPGRTLSDRFLCMNLSSESLHLVLHIAWSTSQPLESDSEPRHRSSGQLHSTESMRVRRFMVRSLRLRHPRPDPLSVGHPPLHQGRKGYETAPCFHSTKISHRHHSAQKGRRLSLFFHHAC